MSKNTLYFVGDKRSSKTRQYLAVAADRAEAERLADELPGATCVVEKHVRRRGR